MAYETQMQDHFLDMEVASETDHMLETSAPTPARSRSLARTTVLGGVLLAVVVGCTVAALVSTRPRTPTGKVEKVMSLAADWSDILGGDAMDTFQSAQAATSTQASATTAVASTFAATTLVAGTTPAAATSVDASTTAESIEDILAEVSGTTTAPAITIPAPAPVTVSSAGEVNVQELAEQFKEEAKAFPEGSYQYQQMMNIYNGLVAKMASATTPYPTAVVTPTTVAAGLPMASTTTDDPLESPLAPQQTVGDGNECPDDEEEVAKVCYKKCSDLTGGSHPIRTSPFSCCAAQPCSFSNTWTHMGFCGGYAVAADSEAATAGNCPTSPGACLADEEEIADMCYQKCSTLTNGEYPHRVAASSCCKTTGLACLLPSNAKTDPSYTVGGGAGDGNSGTPSTGHVPLTSVTR
mmetsp:Transcript_98933/g.176273  ORF Transcript_98933/g.176273 Transcript_98933/m.176273 type:complete len:410 (-) Transcript_98933:130-1359(-)|eukprot:CAMPEP_0197659406 /NCGR_PEP_ID=MMETSP1338-20131121/47542_1 /TAXON_ID=43686 ORGANISM="Pelagodinium beii, Strain RCC1491" /NCGR_SAMPLE_ID=MMETSP1338 /ASSEMBLY_ACC=CAM_ASM_000754 /LENGTH=409 /DNA_ID=CAMNT_0043236321 /DNA_START=101 /DNA_END=1330 /DNA_ORIENTATION=+